jgi:GABA(A) receptor-associated protein
MSFREKYSLYERSQESKRIRTTYPSRYPVICERNPRSRDTYVNLKKTRYIVPHDLSVSQFIYVIRKQMQLQAEKAIFLFVNGIVPSANDSIMSLYETHHDMDGFLYITYSFENVFGA